MNSELFMVKKYLKAKNADELIRLQLKNNIENGVVYRYDITHDGNEWFAWYLASAKDLVKQRVQEELNA